MTPYCLSAVAVNGLRLPVGGQRTSPSVYRLLSAVNHR